MSHEMHLKLQIKYFRKSFWLFLLHNYDFMNDTCISEYPYQKFSGIIMFICLFGEALEESKICC